MCAGSEVAQHGSCSGDSGGPLMHSDDATKQCNNIMYSFLYELLFKAAMNCWIISKRADYGDMLDLRACWTG